MQLCSDATSSLPPSSSSPQAYELSTLTGTQVLLLVVSESGWVYTFTTDQFKPLVKEDEFGNLSQGQKLIAACLVRLSSFSTEFD